VSEAVRADDRFRHAAGVRPACASATFRVLAKGDLDADPALATRIAGVLSSRGLGDRDLVKRALTEGSGTCDTEDQSVRAEALI